MNSKSKCAVVLWAFSMALVVLSAESLGQSQPLSSIPVRTDSDELLKGLALTPTVFRAAAEHIRPALVTIESFAGVSTAEGRIGGIRGHGEGNTTGVMISADGLIVTSSFNFIQQPRVITVITSDGQRRLARLLGRDDTRQICLLRADGCHDVPIAENVDPQTVRVGQWAMSIGVGYGDTNPAVSLGIVSAKNRAGGRAIQTDANISPANYGGPLIDCQGRMIGVCVPLNPNSLDIGAGVEWYDSGIGFAIPLSGLDERLKQLADGQEFYPAYLGVTVKSAEDMAGVRIAMVDSLENRARAIAARKQAQNATSRAADDNRQTVQPEEHPEKYDYPAFAAGLKSGDVITAVGDIPVIDIRSLRIAIGHYNAGDKVTVHYQRGDDVKTVDIAFGRPPKFALEENTLPAGPPPGN